MLKKVSGIYGGLVEDHGDDVVFKFVDGTVKAFAKKSVKRAVEKIQTVEVEGIIIIPNRTSTRVAYENLAIVFATDELFLFCN